MLFAALALVFYRLCPARYRAVVLLLLSYIFYCTWSLEAAVWLAGVTLLTFFGARLAANPESLEGEPSKHGKWLFLILAVLLAGYLFFFKLAAIAAVPGVGRIALPLGLSYYTFKLISYVLDCHWGKIEPETRIVSFASYVAFFPQLMGGPIQRAESYLPQLPPVRLAVAEGLPRIVWGLFKKIAVADQLGLTVNYVYANMRSLHGAQLLAGFLLFPLQLYADFSGLTDIAIGLGLLLGIRGPENFNRPFTASTITEFWRRWHMTLTGWLGDYVFTPLRMATRNAGTASVVFSITVNTVAIGLWHGFTWGYLVFGLVHSAYLVTEALTWKVRARFFRKNPNLDGWGSRLGAVMVFFLAMIAFVFFRAVYVSDAAWGLVHVWDGLGSVSTDLGVLIRAVSLRPLVIGLIGFACIEIGERFRPDIWMRKLYATWPGWAQEMFGATTMTLLVAAVYLLLLSNPGPDRPFIYEAF
jgi:D-alanyl-lipoteichoic acid acyltransferase DltB (MBOAT superfamily)